MSCLIQISSSSNGCETHNVKINMKCNLFILLNVEFSFNAYHKNEMRKIFCLLKLKCLAQFTYLGTTMYFENVPQKQDLLGLDLISKFHDTSNISSYSRSFILMNNCVFLRRFWFSYSYNIKVMKKSWGKTNGTAAWL